jgi:uncharacterized protein with FMN-binding domain
MIGVCRKMRKILKIIGIILVSFIVVSVAACIIASKVIKEPVFAINLVDIQKVADGTYEGEYNTSLVKATVKVSVKNKVITELNIIKHDNGLGKKAEKITNSVLEAQSLQVDTISGATLSSRVILKATQNALEKGIK